ncbi:tyrosine-type recombinase/integrase [Mycobacterium avium subsp. paratuberculosis]|nr:tyrosine-type recombinase/integrase [Mycobacterium avium]AZP81970.1 integrase [Mycobacterium avium subsp. paratuberculosis]QPM72318.1 tyrosine-type recombinase/integrase [Mycobacterium avium subsp. paratuberculosis S397]QQK51080.1 tyrosine-type recombinase/integrase [Mycobacterium avium subsp. paratuberculosis]
MIEPRVGPHGTRVYRARVYYRGRYVASRTFFRKRDAQEWERKQVETLKTGAWADPKAGERPVREWCEMWLSAQPVRAPATERKIRGVIGKQIAGTFGRRPLVSVRPSEVQAWAAEISRKQSAATARHSLGVLRRVFEHAVRDGAIHRNPAAGIRLPKVQGNDPRPLTHDELWRLADHMNQLRDRLLIVVAGYCGLRWGELAALRWADVDLANKTLRVARAYSEEAPRGEMSPVKDHQARTVPIPAIVSEELATFRTDQKPNDLVFPSANGTPLRNRNFRRDVFDDAAEDLGLNITPHNLRDTAASLAIQAGASVVAVARLLGHESAATTLNHYAAFFPTDLDDVASRLNAAARLTIAVQRARQDREARIEGELGQQPGYIEQLEYDAAHPENAVEVDGEQASARDETEYLLSSPENARRLLEALGRDKAIHPAPSDTTEAPTTHRPERSDEQ